MKKPYYDVAMMKATRAIRIPDHMAPQKGEIRLFENILLERLSKISPVTVLAVYLPMIIFAVWKSFSIGISVSTFATLFFSGLAVWSLFEYLFHRYVFHFMPRGEFQKRVSFLFHGVHHQYPNDKKRLVMPIGLSLLIGVLLFALSWPLFDTWVWAYSAGFAVGYLAYDMTHYSIHHFSHPRAKWFKNLWKSHLDHHYRDSTKGYGVSSPFWDRVFGTR
jgi:sterol desaturase/sphingolipid hydroxylase (fatty acid hydroxylase superfamily)